MGCFEGGGEVVDDAEVREAEVLHGAGGGADVGGVAGADENDGEAGAGGGGEHKRKCRGKRWLSVSRERREQAFGAWGFLTLVAENTVFGESRIREPSMSASAYWR